MEAPMSERRVPGTGGKDWRERIGGAAARALDETIRAGAERYDRARDLPRLARVDPTAGLAETPENLTAIVARLERALRAARSGHWTYDLNRHIALRQAHRAESERLAAVRNGDFAS
jgi:Family of unknown function (DUF6477)